MPEDDKLIDSFKDYFNEEFEELEIEKGKIINVYRAKTDVLKQEIITLENKIKGLTVQFNTEYASRIKVFEETEAQTRKGYTEMENQKRAMDKDKIDFEVVKNQFYQGVEAADKSIREDRVKNEAILATAESIRQDANKQLQEVKAVAAALEPVKQEIAAREKAITVRENLVPKLEADVRAKTDEAVSKLSLANEKILKADEAKSEAAKEMFNIVAKSSSLQELIDKTNKALEELRKEEALIRAKIEENDYKLAQIIAGRDKNTRDAVANKAKEILLNEKEKTLNEREKNVKVIENDIIKGGQ